MIWNQIYGEQIGWPYRMINTVSCGNELNDYLRHNKFQRNTIAYETPGAPFTNID